MIIWQNFFRCYVYRNIGRILTKGNARILAQLDEIASNVGKALRSRVGFSLAQAVSITVLTTSVPVPHRNLLSQIEVNLAVLWEEAYNDPAQLHARARALKVVAEAQDQLYLWRQAASSNVKFNTLKDSDSETEDIEMLET